MREGGPRRLIITADDLGISLEVNEAVVRAHRDGLLAFASLMAAGPAAEDAVERSRAECPGLGLGLHVVLCAGRSALPPAAIPGLVDDAGRFPDDPVACGLRYFFDRDLGAALEREVRAQFERYLGWGLAPGHVDAHLNIHVHPVVFPLLARLAREYGFGRIRLPGGELARSLAYCRGPWLKQLAEAWTFGLLRRYLLRCHGDPRLEVPQRTFGLLRSGLMREDYVLGLLDGLPAGLTEVYFHPSSDPASEVVDAPTSGHHTVTELRTLLSRSVRELLRAQGVALVRP